MHTVIVKVRDGGVVIEVQDGGRGRDVAETRWRGGSDDERHRCTEQLARIVRDEGNEDALPEKGAEELRHTWKQRKRM